MKKYIFLFLSVLAFSQEAVDGIIAIVGDQAILQSDVVQTAQIQAMQNRVNLSANPNLFNYYLQEALQLLITQNVILIVAEEDTLISVTDDELDMTLEQQIQEYILRAGSEEALEKTLGQTVRDFRREYREELYRMLLIEKYQRSFFSDVEITRSEVEDFYHVYQDSLPVRQPETRYSLIEIPKSISEETRLSVLSEISNLREKIVSGEDFSELAKIHSDDPGTAFSGGDLGYIQRGTLVQEYDEAAFALEINEISQPVLTEFGYHIIQMLDKQGEKIRTRHILKLIQPSEKDSEDALEMMRGIFSQVESDPGCFDSLAVQCKIRYDNLSGVHGWEKDLTIPENLLQAVNDIEPGQYTWPFESQNNTYMIAWLHERKASEKQTLDNSWEYIEEMALQKKISDEFDMWVNREKEGIFIKVF